MTKDALIAHLRSAIDQAGTARAWCEANHVAPSLVSDVLRGRRDPPPVMLHALGVCRIVTYEPLNPEDAQDGQRREEPAGA